MTEKTVFERSGTVLEWMYADAFAGTLAEMNPLRWSSGNCEQTLKGLQKESGHGRPIMMVSRSICNPCAICVENGTDLDLLTIDGQ